MVLFYRENASVRQVATALDLSEDAVRQRLSRGRAMLRTQVTAWVEKSLRKTGPGKAFTLGVLVLLPAAGTEVGAATLAAAGTTSTSAKASSLLGASGAVAGPLAGVLGGVIGARASYRAAQSDAERKFVLKFIWLISGGVLLFGAVFFSVLFYGKQIAGQHPILFASIIAAVVIAYMTALVVAIYKANERQRQIQIEQGTYNPAHDLPLQALPGRSLLLNLAAGVGGSLSWVLIATFQLRHWYFFSLTLIIGIATVAIALKLSLLNRSKSQRYAIFACAAMGVWTLALLDTLPEVLLAHIEKTGEWKNLIIIGVNLFIILLHGAILGSIWLRNRRAAFFYERRNQQS